LREVATDFASDTDNEAIRVLLGFSLPVFLRPNNEPQLSVRWRVVRHEHNKLKLYLHNQGTQHVQVVSVDIHNDKGRILSKQPEMAYVLPDNQRAWLLDMESLDTTPTINLVAKTNNGELREALALEQP
jgi:P pilus assembly chaperone PapD